MCMMSSKWIWVQGFYVMATYWNNCFVILHIVKTNWKNYTYLILNCRDLHNSVRQKLLKLIVFKILECSAKIDVLRTFVFCDMTIVFFREGSHFSWYCPPSLLNGSSAKGDFVVLVEMTMFCDWLKDKKSDSIIVLKKTPSEIWYLIVKDWIKECLFLSILCLLAGFYSTC